VAPDSGKISGSNIDHDNGSALLLVEISFRRRGHHHNDSLWAEHLELQATIVRDGHELGVAWLPQQSVVRTGKVDHLKL
jgi:hypothetical protein